MKSTDTLDINDVLPHEGYVSLRNGSYARIVRKAVLADSEDPRKVTYGYACDQYGEFFIRNAVVFVSVDDVVAMRDAPVGPDWD